MWDEFARIAGKLDAQQRSQGHWRRVLDSVRSKATVQSAGPDEITGTKLHLRLYFYAFYFYFFRIYFPTLLQFRNKAYI